MYFRVLVLTYPGQDPEVLLERYQAYEDGHGPYSQWHERTDEWRQEYETGTVEAIQLPDGSYLSTYSMEFERMASNGELTNKHQQLVPFPVVYPSFSKFVSVWYRGEGPNNAGEYGFWQNPNPKWDWLGSRGLEYDLYHPEGLTSFPATEWNGSSPFAVITPDGQWHENPHAWEEEGHWDQWDAQVREFFFQYPDTRVKVFSVHC